MRSRMLAVIAALTLIGCANKGDKKPPESPVPHVETHGQDRFEKSDDPPFSADTRFAAGQLAESQGAIENAIAQYKEALKLDPNHRSAIFRLAGLYTETKRFPEAIAMWDRYLRVTKNSAAAYNNLAVCYQAAGQKEDAEKAFQLGIAKDPTEPSCHVNYGLMLAREGRLDEAMKQLGAVLSQAEVHYNLGAVFEEMGKKAEARAYYKKALELDPKLIDARSRLARLQ